MGTVESVGAVLYTGYLLPFEITSILLLAAMVGVIVLAKKKPG
jgi:NADH-quinone oxidoreductase subunit J